MQTGLYAGLSAQVALQRRVETIAHNLANASTVGFRAEEIRFDSLLPNADADPVSYLSTGSSYISRRGGELTETGNQLDVAVKGDAWLGIQTPGGVVYSRDGRLKMLDTGQVVSIEGYPVLDAGGAPITLNPNGGLPRIAPSGMISQGNQQLGAIGLFRIPADAKLQRFSNSGVIPDQPAIPVVDQPDTGVVQGYVERANVNAVTEITSLIAVQRAFEAIANVSAETESSLQDAIRTLGSSG